MDIILIIHLLKLGLHQFLFFIHIFNNLLNRIYSGNEGIKDSVIIIVGIILKLGVAQSSSKCLALPNALEICRTLLFHVIEALTPKAFRSYGNSVLTAILSILLPFVLALELRRIGLPTVLVDALSTVILHKLLELPGDIGLHFSIFIIGRLIRVITLGHQCHTFTFTRLTNPC